MTNDAVWDAFCTKVATFAAGFSPDVPPIFQGVPGTPPDTGTWLELRFFPNKTRNYGVVGSEVISLVGFCQIMACSRTGEGNKPAVSLADAAVDYFDTGTELGPAYVDQPPYASSVLDDMPDRIRVPVTVPYAAHGSR